MPSTVVFNMSDPDVKQMIDGWADNTEYTATITFKTGAGDQRNVGVISEVVPEEGPPSTEHSSPEGESMPPEGMKPGMKMGMKMKAAPELKY